MNLPCAVPVLVHPASPEVSAPIRLKYLGEERARAWSRAVSGGRDGDGVIITLQPGRLLAWKIPWRRSRRTSSETTTSSAGDGKRMALPAWQSEGR